MNVSILIRHSGIWKSDVLYSGYKSDGIIVGENISFVNLRSAIAIVLDINKQIKKVDIWYVVKGNASPIYIRNDIRVKLHLEINKKERGFGV